MGMNNPHNPDKAMWEAYVDWMGTYAADRSNTTALETADYYLEQWWKCLERRLETFKPTPGDRKLAKPLPEPKRIVKKKATAATATKDGGCGLDPV